MPIASVNPATGETVRTFQPHGPAQIEERLGRSERSFATWRRTPFAERAQVLHRAAQLLEERREALARLMTLEMGKLLKAGRGEVDKCALACRFYAEEGERLLADELVATDARRSLIRYQPLGPVLAVMPWNFPFWQVFRFAAPALAAGNVGLLKHASNVPQCALAIEEVLRDAGAPEGTFQTLLVGAAEIERIVQDPRVRAATLTGSEAAGKSLAKSAGSVLKKVVLELGGSDPFVVLPSADLQKAIAGAVQARLQANAGQSCIAAKRFIVHRDVARAFEEGMTSAMARLRVGDPLDEATEVGPLASEQVLRDVDAQVRASCQAGARLATGGKREGERGFFYAPTVLTGVTKGMPAADEEVFGPVAAVLRVASLDEAIAAANDTRYGLGASAWSQDAREQERLASELEAGSVFINGVVKSDPRLPFGGIKDSGYGRELGREGLREFVNIKTVWVG